MQGDLDGIATTWARSQKALKAGKSNEFRGRKNVLFLNVEF